MTTLRPFAPPCRPETGGAARRVLCAVLAAALAWAPTAATLAQQNDALRLPALGESASDEFNLSAEKRLGEQIMREIRRDPDYLDDPQLLDYLQSVWQPLVQAAKARGDIGPDTEHLFPYEPFLVRDRSVNAFALPGGYVGVHLALIAMTATRDELASVLAHELSHITQRHIARSIVAANRSSTLGLAAILIGIFAAARASNADMANAALATGQAAVQQTQLNFSRDMEREADRNGIAVLSGAGFAPAGMAAMFEKLDQANRLNDNGSYPYLRSHPLTSDRIGEARQRIDNLPAGTSDPQPLLQALMRARARVLMDSSASAQQRLQDLAQRGDQPELPRADRLGAMYGAALASLQLRDLPAAERSAARARALFDSAPSAEAGARRTLARLQVQLALARGDLGRAHDALAEATDDGSRASLLQRAQVSLAEGSTAALRDASDALQVWVAEHRSDAGAWAQLALVANRQGQTLRAVRADAEAQAALGDLRGAIDRMRAGQLIAQRGGPGTNFIEASVIDARLRDLQTQRRGELREQRGGGNGRQAPDND